MGNNVFGTFPTQSAAVVYTRTEPVVRSVELKETLGAQVHDALWMLTQQWRVGEYKGSDGGSIHRAKVKTKSSKVNVYELNGNSEKEYTGDLPLETIVEQVKYNPDALLRLEMGKQWLRLLKKYLAKSVNINDPVDSYLGDFKNKVSFQINVDSNNYESSSETKYNELLELAAGMFDGYELYIDITENNNLAKSSAHNTDVDADIDLAEQDFLDYVSNLVYTEDESAWNVSALEYRYRIASPEDISSTSYYIMGAENHQSSVLNWYDTDGLNSSAPITINPAPSVEINQHVREYIPSPVKFEGMPTERWWQFEDKNIDLANFRLSKRDLTKMMIMEFGLVYSNDWFILPQRLRAGTVNQVEIITVTDVFGKHTIINPAGTQSGNSWQRWSMYTLNEQGANADPSDTRLYIPPSIVNKLEGKPIEEVLFFRDEVANMVWGLENTVPSALYGGLDGTLAELELQNYLRENNVYELQFPLGVDENDAEVKFELSNSVPENWVPFIPVQSGDSNRNIQFQRATLKRIINQLKTTHDIVPRTSILNYNVGSGPYFVNEEEIPRSGASVKSNYQRTRWYNGKVVTWMGRRKTNGKGEGTSGLEFDTLKGVEEFNSGHLTLKEWISSSEISDIKNEIDALTPTTKDEVILGIKNKIEYEIEFRSGATHHTIIATSGGKIVNEVNDNVATVVYQVNGVAKAPGLNNFDILPGDLIEIDITYTDINLPATVKISSDVIDHIAKSYNSSSQPNNVEGLALWLDADQANVTLNYITDSDTVSQNSSTEITLDTGTFATTDIGKLLRITTSGGDEDVEITAVDGSGNATISPALTTSSETGLTFAVAHASAWDDITANAQSFTQSTAANQPIYFNKVSDANNEPALLFDGSDDFLKGDKKDLVGERTIYIVSMSTSTEISGNYGRTLFGDQYSSYGTSIREAIAGGVASIAASHAILGVGSNATSSESLRSGFRSLTLKLERGDFSLRVDQQPASQSNQLDTITSPQYYYIGKHSSLNSSYWLPFHGYVAEILIYDQAHSDEQIKIVENYLKTKYNL